LIGSEGRGAILTAMATRERPADRGRRRAKNALERLGREHRQARIGAGLSLRAVGDAAGTSHQRVLRFEHGTLHRPSIDDVGAWCEVVGLELAIRAYPAGDPLRDAGQLRLLERLRRRVHPSLGWQTEVALAIEGDRRAWDAVVSGPGWQAAVEAETVLRDVQALERRLNVKRRDGRAGEVLLVIADTAANRVAFAAASGSFPGFDRRARRVLAALQAGHDPGGDAIVLL
jgi:transcriptional regulator with XRE-family HTH domain